MGKESSEQELKRLSENDAHLSQDPALRVVISFMGKENIEVLCGNYTPIFLRMLLICQSPETSKMASKFQFQHFMTSLKVLHTSGSSIRLFADNIA